jgi:hypothetical protein
VTFATTTNATAYQTQYALPGAIVNVNGLVSQSRVKVYRVDTGAFLAQAYSGAGTTVAFDIQYTGAVYIEARNASFSPAYIPWVTQTNITQGATTTVTALQVSE